MLWVLLYQKIIFGTDFSYGTKTIPFLLPLQFSTQLLHDHDTAPLQPGSHMIISHYLQSAQSAALQCPTAAGRMGKL